MSLKVQAPQFEAPNPKIVRESRPQAFRVSEAKVEFWAYAVIIENPGKIREASLTHFGCGSVIQKPGLLRT